MKAKGQVTGTDYLIVPTGTWVWNEDLPALLREMRACCPATDEPVRAFYLGAGSIGNVVPYRPWPVKAAAVEATGVAGASTPFVPLHDTSVRTANHVEAGGKEEAPRLSSGETEAPAQGAGLEQATDEAKAADVPSQGRRKHRPITTQA